jgi:hypothetical protein
MDVCHTCDIRLCVNPAHLFLGTRSDNMRDALKKGRLDPRRGASNGNAALTSAAAACVLRRFSEGESLRSIARSMGVSATTCRGIASGLRYKEVQPPLKASAAASSETPA